MKAKITPELQAAMDEYVLQTANFNACGTARTNEERKALKQLQAKRARAIDRIKVLLNEQGSIVPPADPEKESAA